MSPDDTSQSNMVYLSSLLLCKSFLMTLSHVFCILQYLLKVCGPYLLQPHTLKKEGYFLRSNYVDRKYLATSYCQTRPAERKVRENQVARSPTAAGRQCIGTPSLQDTAFFRTSFLHFPRGCIFTKVPSMELIKEIIVQIIELKKGDHWNQRNK